MTVDLDKLEQLARAATPGPWESEIDRFDDDEIVATVADAETKLLATIGTGVEPYDGAAGAWTSADSVARDARWAQAKDSQAMRDAAFIAALSPDVVLALVKELREARARVAYLEDNIEIY